VSPDGARVAVAGELGGLLVLEVASGTFFPLAAPEHGAINDVAFSGDSRWVTWAEPVTTEGARTRIRIARAEKGAEVHDLTDGRFRDSTPVFTRDGKYLAFLSDRSFDPVYDTHRFDLSFPASTKPFLVALAADTPSPFGPAAHSARPAGNGQNGGAPDAGPNAVSVDADRIGERIIAVPVAQGRYESLSAVEGALLWTAGDAGGLTGDGRATPSDQEPARRLERFDLQRRTVEVLVAEADSYRGQRGRLDRRGHPRGHGHRPPHLRQGRAGVARADRGGARARAGAARPGRRLEAGLPGDLAAPA
jgi:tricorn protease